MLQANSRGDVPFSTSIPNTPLPIMPDGVVACRVRTAVAQPLADGATVYINYELEDFDDPSGAMHDLVTNNSRITPVRFVVNGDTYYRFTAYVSFAANANGNRYVSIVRNHNSPSDVIVIAEERCVTDGANGTQLSVTVIEPVVPGDFFEVAVIQTSGVSINIGRTVFAASLVKY